MAGGTLCQRRGTSVCIVQVPNLFLENGAAFVGLLEVSSSWPAPFPAKMSENATQYKSTTKYSPIDSLSLPPLGRRPHLNIFEFLTARLAGGSASFSLWFLLACLRNPRLGLGWGLLPLLLCSQITLSDT